MNIRIAICDDEPTQIHQLQSYLERFEIATDYNLNISTFTSSKTFLDTYTKTGMFHIVFLDIEMPEPNGLETAQKIRLLPDKRAKIVFITHHSKYMKPSFSVHPYEFLDKPLSYDTFFYVMCELCNDLTESDEHIIKIADELIHVTDILYITIQPNQKNHLSFHLRDKILEDTDTLTNWEIRLKDFGFLPCYKGTLVNLAFIHQIKNHKLLLTNNEVLPLSRRCEKAIQDMFYKSVISLYRTK